MSTETSSPFQERGWQREGSLLRGDLAREVARWFKSKKVWLGILIWLLVINLILFFTTTGLRQVATAPAAAGGPPPGAVAVLLYGFFVGMLVTFGAMIVARGAAAGETRAGRAVPRATTVRMEGKLEAGREPVDPGAEVVLLARFLLAQASLERATRLWQGPPEAAETGEPFERALEMLNLQVAASPVQGEPLPVMAALERARTLAQPEQTAAPKTQHPKQAMVEPLSERELEVLELVAEGLTNREIAARLYLAVNTVKAHAGNIYGKLGVHSRTQAVARARAWGLLPFCAQEPSRP